MRSLLTLLLAASALAQGHHRTENVALLGIVAVPAPAADDDRAKPRVVIAHVLKKSPAAKAGIQVGDELKSIAGKAIRKPQDVDAALKAYAGSEKVEIALVRDKKDVTVKAKLIVRKKYRGEFLEKQTRGRTGFKAPDWYVYEWSAAGEAPPTRANTKGKVVVLHCFQGW